MANSDLRDYARRNGVKLWQIAKEKGISEPTMTRLLREELSEKEKASFRRIVDKISNRN